MSKVIIGIHGLHNKPPRKILEKWWELAIIEGFRHLGLKLPKLKFELLYWADLIYEQPNNQTSTDKKDPYFIEEPYTQSPNHKIPPKETGFRKKMLQFIESQLEKIFLNDDFSLNYIGVNDLIMHHYFKELEMYYSKMDTQHMLRHTSRLRLVSILKKYKYDDIMIISHSMGSIIAYDVLQFELKNQKIHTFVTMGSPLGSPFILAKIAEEMKSKNQKLPIRTPNCVTNNWLNFADLEDKIALNFDLNNDFYPNAKGIQAIDFEVINDYEINGVKNPHKSFGYLRSPEFILQLNIFLTEKSPFTLKKLTTSFQKVSHKMMFKKVQKLHNHQKRIGIKVG